MLDIQLLKKDLPNVIPQLERRHGYKFSREEFENLEAQRKLKQTEAEAFTAKVNAYSKEFGLNKSKGLPIDLLPAKYFGTTNFKEEQRRLDAELAKIQIQLDGSSPIDVCTDFT